VAVAAVAVEIHGAHIDTARERTTRKSIDISLWVVLDGLPVCLPACLPVCLSACLPAVPCRAAC